MNYFYVRNRNFIAIFKRSKKAITCEVIPSRAMTQAILDHPNLKYDMITNVFEDTDDPEEKEFLVERADEEEDDEDIEGDKLNPNINF